MARRRANNSQKENVMRTKYAVFMVFLAMLGIMSVGCVEQSADKYRVFENSKVLIEDLQARMPQLSVKELQTKLENEEEFTLIDVRTLKEFNSGSIPGAVHISRGLLEFQVEKEFPERTEEIVIYCQKDGRGLLAVEALMRIGYQNVKNLEGGWTAWKDDSFKDAVDGIHHHSDDGGGC
ncbi:hypothetical protein CSA56_18155 [candidate division KSB3 bacterium]|uniref:Rhodanese domain-containing protein n=1 Tax=candidate division KSB3 bacterium TaxID=2044937 RepID=A0A2G6K941_9BACT|nr:MAG: hypothetical protein CSA56_18155 [candidate division KSB3 bacterium]